MVPISAFLLNFLSKNTPDLFQHFHLSEEIEEETIGEYNQG